MSDDLFGGNAARKPSEAGATPRAGASSKAAQAKAAAVSQGSLGTPGESGYTAQSIEVLEGLEPVRRRPGMYIGGTDEKALHHLFAEVIGNSVVVPVVEAVAKHMKKSVYSAVKAIDSHSKCSTFKRSHFLDRF